MNFAKLRTGKTVPMPTAETTFLSLRRLAPIYPAAMFELVELCKNSDYKPLDDSIEILRKHSLIQEDGRVHDDVRDITLAAIKGEGLNMTLVSPVADPTENS